MYSFPLMPITLDVPAKRLVYWRRACAAQSKKTRGVNDTALAKLRKRLYQAPRNFDTTALSRRDLRMCIYLMDEDALTDKLHRVFEQECHRMPDRALGRVVCYEPTLQAPLVQLATRASQRTLRGPEWMQRLPRSAWRSTYSLVTALAAHPVVQATSLPEVATRLGIPVPSALGTSVQEEWLRRASDTVLSRTRNVHHEAIRARSIPASLQVALADRYVALDGKNVTGPSNVKDAILLGRLLEILHEKYGGWPSGIRNQTRWSAHTERTKKLARYWGISASIQQFFGDLHGDKRRLAYWRRWISQIEDTEIFTRANAFMLRIGSLHVVEFGNTGNAAYFYEHSSWNKLNIKRVNHPGDLKSKTLAITTLNHNGKWEFRADNIMTRLTGRSPRS